MKKLFLLTLFALFFATNAIWAQTTTTQTPLGNKVVAKKSSAVTTTATNANTIAKTTDKAPTALPNCNTVLGGKISQLQTALLLAGYDPGPADNTLGPRTRQALIKFQKDHNLPVGNLNMETLNALTQILVEKGICTLDPATTGSDKQ